MQRAPQASDSAFSESGAPHLDGLSKPWKWQQSRCSWATWKLSDGRLITSDITRQRGLQCPLPDDTFRVADPGVEWIVGNTHGVELSIQHRDESVTRIPGLRIR